MKVAAITTAATMPSWRAGTQSPSLPARSLDPEFDPEPEWPPLCPPDDGADEDGGSVGAGCSFPDNTACTTRRVEALKRGLQVVNVSSLAVVSDTTSLSLGLTTWLPDTVYVNEPGM